MTLDELMRSLADGGAWRIALEQRREFERESERQDAERAERDRQRRERQQAATKGK